MPVPKRKSSRSRRDMKHANKGLQAQSVALCWSGAPCQGEPKMPHEVCQVCGYYKGKKVLLTKFDRENKRKQASVKSASTEDVVESDNLVTEKKASKPKKQVATASKKPSAAKSTTKKSTAKPSKKSTEE